MTGTQGLQLRDDNLGPMARLLGFGNSPKRAWLLVLLLTLAAALPLFALADWGPVDVPLTRDYSALVRLFVALPLLVLSGPLFDQLVNDAMGQAGRTGLLAGEALAAHDRWANTLRRLRGSALMEALFAVAAILVALSRPSLPGALAGLSGWGFDASGQLNAAGFCYAYVVLPLFRFLILLWVWRLLLWTLYISRLAFLPLHLKPAHPDGAAGLGYLGFVQQRLSMLLAAGSFMLAGSAANRIAHRGETLSDLFHPLMIYVVGYPLLLLVPLLLLFPTLMRVKRQAIFDYGLVGQKLAVDFQHGWIDTPGRIDTPLESPHPSAMTDFAAMHAAIENMRPIPIRLFGFGIMLASTIAPLLLLVLLMVSFETLVKSALAEVPPFDMLSAVDDRPIP